MSSNDMSTETLKTLIQENPKVVDKKVSELRGQVAEIEAKISELLALKGEKRRGRKPGQKNKKSKKFDTSGNEMPHKAALLKVLKAKGKKGAVPSEIREAAKSELNHEFGNSLSVLLNKETAGENPEIGFEQIEEGKRRYRYFLAQ